MSEPRFQHKKIKELLLRQRQWLQELQKHYKSIDDFRSYSLNEHLDYIDRILNGREKDSRPRFCAGTDCHFVKNGFYMRGKEKIQTLICSVCRKPQSSNKLRIGISEYTQKRLIQLKLEGLPMKTISGILGIEKYNLEYYWHTLRTKCISNFNDASSCAASYIRRRKTPAANFLKGQQYWIEFPIEGGNTVRVTREFPQFENEQIIRVRLAQILLLTPRYQSFYPKSIGGHFGPKDAQRVSELLNTPIHEIDKLPKPADADIVQVKSLKIEESSKYNLKFSYTRIYQRKFLGLIGERQWNGDVTF